MNNNLFLIVDQVRGSIKNFIDANPNVPEKQIRKNGSAYSAVCKN